MGELSSQPAIITIDNYNNVNIVGPSLITQRLMFAAAAAANIGVREIGSKNEDNVNKNDDSKEDIPDAATRKRRVAATAAAFLKSMDADELLEVVPEEEPTMMAPDHIGSIPCCVVNDEVFKECDNPGCNNVIVAPKHSNNADINQIHDHLYRQLTRKLYNSFK